MAGARTVLAFDFGRRRIGVAVGQELTGSAAPLVTLAVRNERPDWDAIAALVETWQPDLFVLGRAHAADGSPTALDAALERFARRLAGRYGRPVSFVDERLSSYAAGDHPRAGRAGLDAASASVILETWFAENPPRPTP
ncbi:MAG: Holliday junction resolvase RuvX [Gammaproteobacteria bacterium]